MIALILGGGAGTRLYPLTQKHAKPAISLAGKYRLVDIPISNCLNSGINKIFVLTQFNSVSLNQHIKNTYNFNCFNHGFVDILAAEQTACSSNWFQGTADAVRQSLKYLANLDEEDILILSGDQLYQMDFQHFYEMHQEKQADISIATIPVHAEDATKFGIMKVDETDRIQHFIEKPTTSQLPDWIYAGKQKHRQQRAVYLASMGIYLFKKAVLIKLLTAHTSANDFGKEIIPIAIQANYKVSAFQFKGYWTDIGTIKSYMKANLALTDSIPSFNLFDNSKKIYTRARSLPPATIRKSLLDRVILGDGCIIEGAFIEKVVIGVRSRIGKGTTIKHSIILGNDKYESLPKEDYLKKNVESLCLGVGENCYIENTIIGKNCCIGADVYLKGGKDLKEEETSLYCVRDGIIIIKENAILPDGFSLRKSIRKKRKTAKKVSVLSV